jgi:hypothetical protein
MNTTIKNFSKVLLTAITIFSMSIISSCSKDGEPGAAGKDGLNGAVGAIGAIGATGATGGIGNNGPAGPTGTANVIYSNWISADFVATGSAYYFTIPLPASIPFQTLRDTYHIAVYYDYGGAFYQLPMKEFNLNVEISYILSSSIGGFRIQAARAGVATPDVINPFLATYTSDRLRYVLIPGAVPSGRGVTPPNYSNMSYQEICKKFNIPQ